MPEPMIDPVAMQTNEDASDGNGQWIPKETNDIGNISNEIMINRPSNVELKPLIKNQPEYYSIDDFSKPVMVEQQITANKDDIQVLDESSKDFELKYI